MAETGRSRWLPWTATLAIAGLVAAWAATREAPRDAIVREVEPTAIDAGTMISPEEPPPPASPSTAPAPPVSAAAPPGCPDDDPDAPDLVRPSVWDALRVRTDELRDRLPQISRDASPDLRAGLNGLHGSDPASAIDALLRARDRDRDGFDVAVAAILHAGMRALAEGDLRAAEQRARTLTTEAPDDALAHALGSLVAERAHDPTRARDAMLRAYALAHDEPAFALAAARFDAEAAHFDRAVLASDAYLHAMPDDARVRGWRDRMAARDELTRGDMRRSAAGIDVVWSGRALPTGKVDRVIAIVRETLDEVARLTGHARRPELAVVIYGDRAAMRRATCTPSWTGAVFDGVLHLDAETVGRDDPSWERVVRHEATHAQLARLEARIPQWLNEGFAQWMEGPPSDAARHAWQRMVRDRFWIPFESLEGGLLVIDDPSDAGLAYHQSLAMMLFLVERRGPRVIAHAAERLEAGRHEGLLEELVPGASGETLLAFLAAREAR